jgi:hypothetical protein
LRRTKRQAEKAVFQPIRRLTERRLRLQPILKVRVSPDLHVVCHNTPPGRIVSPAAVARIQQTCCVMRNCCLSDGHAAHGTRIAHSTFAGMNIAGFFFATSTRAPLPLLAPGASAAPESGTGPQQRFLRHLTVTAFSLPQLDVVQTRIAHRAFTGRNGARFFFGMSTTCECSPVMRGSGVIE